MIDLVIERGIPVPPAPEYRSRSGRPPLYDWSRLEVGDSVLVATRSAAHTAYAFGASRQRVFTAEKQTVGARGWRVWRVT